MIHFLTMGGLSSLRIRLLLQLVAPRNYSYKRETESQNKWKLDIYTFKQKDSIVFDQCVFLDEQLFLCLLHIVLNMGTLLEHCRCIQEFDEQRGKDITPLAEHNLAILLKQPQSCQSHHCRPLSLSLKGKKRTTVLDRCPRNQDCLAIGLALINPSSARGVKGSQMESKPSSWH